MKALRSVLYPSIVLLILLAACAPASTPPSEPQPTPTVESGGPPATPSLVPINLIGPEMRVGATWLYVDGTLLVPVPGGIYTRGHGGPDDPVKQVNVSDFWIYRTKVTNGQYAYCVATGYCTRPVAKDDPAFDDPLHANDPVVGVDYSQAKAYCAFTNARLPAEAEWEKMARGLDARIYPWGEAAPNCNLLNYETCQGKTTPVNTYPQGQSYFHAFDTEGNTFEWVADWYQQDYYLIAPPDDPPGPARGVARVVRSSAFNSGTNQTQVYNRFHSGPADHRNNLGFRCVVEDPAYFAPFCNYPATYGTDGVGGGGSGGGEVTVDCPTLKIQQNPVCEGTTPITTVTLTGPAGSTINVPQPPCSPTGNPNQFTCTGDGQVSICSQCTVTKTSQPQCPNGYELDPTTGQCLGHPATGNCLPGFTLGTGEHRGPVLTTNTPSPSEGGGQCCTFDPGSVHLTTDSDFVRGGVFPSCPAGTWFDGTECISVSIQTPYCKPSAIDLKSCEPTSCELSPSSCSYPYCTFDPKSCSCKYDTSCG